MIPSDVRCVYVRQPEALGLGHAVLCAKSLIKDEPFAVLLADDLIWSESAPVLSQMRDVYEKYSADGVIAVQTVRPSETDQYGVVEISGLEHQITGVVEKPKAEEAPSNLGVVGRYILPPEIFSALENVETGAGGEIQLTDAISALLQDQKIHAHLFDGKRYDCGSKFGYLQANVEYALRNESLGDRMRDYLGKLKL